MEKETVILFLKEKIDAYNKLPKHIQNENKFMLVFLKEQLKAAKNGEVSRAACWHASSIYQFVGIEKSRSLRDYYAEHGESINNIIGFKEVEVFDLSDPYKCKTIKL